MNNLKMNFTRIQLLSAGIVFLSVVVFTFGSHQITRASNPAYNEKIYLPLTAHSYRNSPPVLLGFYPNQYDYYMGNQNDINSSVKALDQWAGKQTSIIGTFMGLEYTKPWYNVRDPLPLLWDNGYTYFVNLMTSGSAGAIAQGKLDSQIHEYGAQFAYWAAKAKLDGQQRIVFIAPMPEMNITTGNSYGGNPQAFKSAYYHIQDIFKEEFAKQNVPFDTIQWVFAPNGADEPGSDYTFEDYYPGDAATDVVAFSSYNFGYCIGWQYDRWKLGQELYKPFVERMRAMAPGKPIFISQTASTSEYPQHGSFDHDKKSQWFEEVYSYLAGLDGVRAILYYNYDGPCDWALFRSGELYFEGYRQVIKSAAFVYLSPNQMVDTFSTP